MKIHLISTCTALTPWDDIYSDNVFEFLPENVAFSRFSWRSGSLPQNHDFLLSDAEPGFLRATARYIASDFGGATAPCLYLTALSNFSQPFRPSNNQIRTLPSLLRSIKSNLMEIGVASEFVAHTFGLEGRSSFERKHVALCGWLERRDLTVSVEGGGLVNVPERSSLGIQIKRCLSEENLAKYTAALALRSGFEEAYLGDAFAYYLGKLKQLRKSGLQVPANLSNETSESLAAFLLGPN